VLYSINVVPTFPMFSWARIYWLAHATGNPRWRIVCAVLGGLRCHSQHPLVTLVEKFTRAAG